MTAPTQTLTPSPGGAETPATPAARAAAAERDELAAGSCVGRYTVRGLVGEGGMGRVYAASDPELGRTVALKLLRSESEERRARFLREAQAMARLLHPNVLSIHDVGTHDGRVFLAMELVEGDTLAAWLRARRRRWREIRDAFVAAGNGLAAAHEAGIIHRDFKPHNVLVGGGRVVVADFGLARAEDATDLEAPDTPEASVDPGLLGAPLTAVGRLVGTPGYVAPEVVDGLPATARSDQYSFCVALGDALAGAGAPRFLVTAAARGRARDPAQRHASMRALLSVLARDPARTARRVALAAAALALVGAGGYAAAVARSDHAAAGCEAGGERLARAWNGARRAAVAQAFAATGVAHATAVARRLEERLDGYAGEWTAARREACRATHVRHEQPAALLTLRLQCLDRRADDVSALLDALGPPLDRAVVDAALPAADRLPRLTDCADLAQVQAVVPLPADAAERARAEAGLRAASDVDALYRLGRVPAAKERLAALEEASRGLSYAPLESDIAFWRGLLAYRLGPEDQAEAPMAESVRLGVRARDVRREARGWRGLLTFLATYPPRIGEAEQVLRAAESAHQRSDGSPSEAAILGLAAARMYLNAGRMAEAERRLARLLAEIPANDPWNRGVALELQARLLVLTSRDAEAVPVAEEAVALWERALGPDSVKIVAALNTLGGALDHLARGAEAERTVQRALRIQIATYGPDFVDLWIPYNRLGWLAAGRRDSVAARDHAAKLLAIVEPTRSQDPLRWRNALAQAGGVLAAAGVPAEGVPFLRQSLDESLAAGDATRAAIASHYLGGALNDLGQPREGLQRCHDAQEPMGKAFDAETRANTLVCQGRSLLLLGRSVEAVATLEEALATAPRATPADRLETRLRLAQALWAAGADRPRALQVAAQAAAEAGASPGLDRQLAELEAWRRDKTAR